MQDTTADLFMSMSITFALFGVCYYFLTTRHRERMALIERGLPKDYFKDDIRYFPFVLLLGIISIGIAVGIVAGAFLETMENAVSGILPASIFFFLGVSLVASYFVLRRIAKRD